MTVNIGVHDANPSLYHLSRLGLLEQLLEPLGETVAWHQIGGLATARALADGTIDFGGTGSTPPLSAQAAGLDLVYAAVSAPRPGHGALLVRADSDIESLADLKGRTVHLAVGSWQTHFLGESLAAHGLSYGRDITAARSTADSYRRLLDCSVDAWVAQGAELFAARRAGRVRTLVEAGDVIADRSVFFTRRDVADTRAELVGLIVRALQHADDWAAAHLDEAADIAAADQGGTAADWREALATLPWRLEPVSDAFLAEQQEAADILAEAGFLPRPVTVADARHAALDQAATSALATGQEN
ncbi:ABC transporter substrate-binding protein [Streptacidiphilus jiangxiensis]|uniref:Sulfonate transport system substrate-binding protein n=1 Tax=Streptacidiphilus jiangxiensis TaxID=235985 RepID=A0A1H7TC75_STRJI|nr:ABC transporter substrate-binding protein [Streptacidiphilus jiangxiensis]SEL82343.1 sulfonate transport system substrate-binding protein [Streptacidiphilus jiangxiensis]